MLDYVSALWHAGLFADGLAIIDSAADADRSWLFNDQPLPEYMKLDGISVKTGHMDRGHIFFRSPKRLPSRIHRSTLSDRAH